MIRIIIADPNETYCRSLKTLLEQIDDFRVVQVSSAPATRMPPFSRDADIMLLETGLYEECRNGPGKGSGTDPGSLPFLLLAMYPDDLEYARGEAEVILKKAGKREFERQIRRVAGREGSRIAP